MSGPLFSYAGSKATLARWHVTLFPVVQRYVSVFGGLGCEFLHRQPRGIEVLNDIDSDLHNMFSAIRNPTTCAALRRLLLWTPDGRRQFQECQETLDDRDPVRRAWGFLTLASTGDMRGIVRRRTWYNTKHRLISLPERLLWWRDRLQRVKLECLPWQKVIERYDRADTLMYVDPPYHPDSRNSSAPLYRHVLSAEDHLDLLVRLRQCRARVLLCGYPHPVYDDLLSDWVQLEAGCRCLMGNKGLRTEKIWLNYQMPGGGRIHG